MSETPKVHKFLSTKIHCLKFPKLCSTAYDLQLLPTAILQWHYKAISNKLEKLRHAEAKMD